MGNKVHLYQIPKNVEVALELVKSRGRTNLKCMIEKAWNALKRLLVEIWMLKEILVRAQKEMSCRESSLLS